MKIRDVKKRVEAELERQGWQMHEGAISAVVDIAVTELGLAVDKSGTVYNPAPVPTPRWEQPHPQGERWSGSGRRRR